MLINSDIVIERYKNGIRSISIEIPYPSVIRLNMYIRKPFKTVSLSRKNIFKRDKNRCQYCGKNHQAMTIDHLIPKSVGGKDTWENLVCACLRCNGIKGNRTPEQAEMKLLNKPKKPSHLFYLQHLAGTSHTSWDDYLFMN